MEWISGGLCPFLRIRIQLQLEEKEEKEKRIFENIMQLES